MCRLALFNAEFFNRVGKINMTLLFQSLETALGGHGMGVACYSGSVDDGENVLIKKSVTMRPKGVSSVISYAINQRNMEYAVFHTRLATNGSISDFNCHPFISRDKEIILAHNGSITELSHSASDYTDSEIALHVVSDYDLPLDVLDNYNGVFVGIYYGKPFVIKGGSYTDLELALSKDNKAWCFASDFPYKSDIRTILSQANFDIVSVPRLNWYGNDIVKVFLASKKHNWNKWNSVDHGYWNEDTTYSSNKNQTSVSVYTPKKDTTVSADNISQSLAETNKEKHTKHLAPEHEEATIM